MHFSPESLQNRYTFGHILSREVDWSIKNHTLKMVIDPWPGVRGGGQCPRPYNRRLQSSYAKGLRTSGALHVRVWLDVGLQSDLNAVPVGVT